jgi:hypothetical protein
VCTADGASSFQHYLTMTPDPETGFVMLPEVAMNQLIEELDEISLQPSRRLRVWIHLQLELDDYLG